MLTLFHGSDTHTVRAQAIELASSGGAWIHIEKENFDINEIRELASRESLFNAKDTIVLDMLSEKKEYLESLLVEVKLLHESSTPFILIEGKLPAGIVRKVTTAGARVLHFEKKAGEKPNLFQLSDAFIRRDKRSLWLLLNEAWGRGEESEAILAILFWQLKVMRLALHTKNATEAGVNAYTYQKAKRGLSRYKPHELVNLSEALLQAYHERFEGGDINLMLEKFVLEI